MATSINNTATTSPLPATRKSPTNDYQNNDNTSVAKLFDGAKDSTALPSHQGRRKSGTTEQPNILTLPDEILGEILSYCHFQDLKALQLTCQRFHAIVSQHVWPKVMLNGIDKQQPATDIIARLNYLRKVQQQDNPSLALMNNAFKKLQFAIVDIETTPIHDLYKILVILNKLNVDCANNTALADNFTTETVLTNIIYADKKNCSVDMLESILALIKGINLNAEDNASQESIVVQATNALQESIDSKKKEIHR